MLRLSVATHQGPFEAEQRGGYLVSLELDIGPSHITIPHHQYHIPRSLRISVVYGGNIYYSICIEKSGILHSGHGPYYVYMKECALVIFGTAH
jgi:hypothetical protein